MQHPPLKQSDSHSTIENNNHSTEVTPQNELGHSRGGKYNLHPNLNPNYSKLCIYYCVQVYISAPLACHL